MRLVFARHGVSRAILQASAGQGALVVDGVCHASYTFMSGRAGLPACLVFSGRVPSRFRCFPLVESSRAVGKWISLD